MRSCILLGGDKRTLYLRAFLDTHGFSTYCFGVDTPFCPSAYEAALASQYALVLLPLPVCKDGSTVFCTCGPSVPFAEVLRPLRAGHRLCGGSLPDTLKLQCAARGIPCTDYYDAEVIAENAKLTAVGVQCVLEEHDVRWSNPPRVVLTGYGYVAQATAKMLRANGCAPLCAVRNPQVRKTVLQDGFSAMALDTLLQAPPHCHWLINTVPAPLLTGTVLAKLWPSTCLLEVASAPYGIDFEAAKRLHLYALKAPGLPGRYTPKAAAEVIGNRLLNTILS